MLQHTRTWVNSWGAEWTNELQLGDVRRTGTHFYQPLGPASDFFAEASLGTAKSDFDIFGNGFRRTDRITSSARSAFAGLGMRLGSIGVSRVTLGHERLVSSPAISSRIGETTRDTTRFVRVGATFDRLDDPNFPRRGFLTGGYVERRDFASAPDDPITSYALEGLFPVTFDRSRCWAWRARATRATDAAPSASAGS